MAEAVAGMTTDTLHDFQPHDSGDDDLILVRLGPDTKVSRCTRCGSKRYENDGFSNYSHPMGPAPDCTVEADLRRRLEALDGAARGVLSVFEQELDCFCTGDARCVWHQLAAVLRVTL